MVDVDEPIVNEPVVISLNNVCVPVGNLLFISFVVKKHVASNKNCVGDTVNDGTVDIVKTIVGVVLLLTRRNDEALCCIVDCWVEPDDTLNIKLAPLML